MAQSVGASSLFGVGKAGRAQCGHSVLGGVGKEGISNG